jgi:hypothetical protein
VLKNLLIERIILSLSEVSDYKVQVKWGNELLVNFIEQVRDQDSYDHLSDMLHRHMETINYKH